MRQRIQTILWGGWITAYKDFKNGFIDPLQAAESILKPGLILLVSAAMTWFIYVPIHELFHVGGCVFTGGTVTELVMGREYGAGFLQSIFPFITPDTTRYAGRVTGFDPNGDIGYFITVFAPFLLTLFPGVWFLKIAITRRKTWLMGPGIVMGLAPFYNVTGDYFEMGTIVSTRVINLITAGYPSSAWTDFWLLRSDDVFRLLGEVADSPARYGLNTPAGMLVTGGVILMGLILAVSLAGWVYLGGKYLARWGGQTDEVSVETS
ncbi:MAG TPA: hypothetical protein PLV45_05195 [bacterium]|nr:hypothetical protein [bacterium]